MKEYVTIPKTEYAVEIVIEKSRFIAAAIGVDSVEQAVAFVEQKRKKHFDATHNCYAYIVGDKAKFSDDGEPQGTAGLPMYECIKNNNLDCLCVVVTRYFGGVKLGAGGLVRAYSGAVADVLRACPKVQITDCTEMQVDVEYSLLSVLRRALSSQAVEEVGVEYSDQVRLLLRFPTVLYNTITDIITQNTLGKAQFGAIRQLLCPFNAQNK